MKASRFNNQNNVYWNHMIKIKELKEIDFNQVEIADGFFKGWPNHPDKTLHRKILQQSTFCFVAVDEEINQIIGFVTIISDRIFSAYIPLLEVIEPYQHQSIGSQLMQKAYEITQDLYMIDLCCDETLFNFYKQFELFQGHALLKRNFHHQSGK